MPLLAVAVVPRSACGMSAGRKTDCDVYAASYDVEEACARPYLLAIGEDDAPPCPSMGKTPCEPGVVPRPPDMNDEPPEEADEYEVPALKLTYVPASQSPLASGPSSREGEVQLVPGPEPAVVLVRPDQLRPIESEMAGLLPPLPLLYPDEPEVFCRREAWLPNCSARTVSARTGATCSDWMGELLREYT